MSMHENTLEKLQRLLDSLSPEQRAVLYLILARCLDAIKESDIKQSQKTEPTIYMDDQKLIWTRFVDKASGRQFQSSYILIKRAIKDLNKQILSGATVRLNDIWHAIGLHTMMVGEHYIWRSPDLISICYEQSTAEYDPPRMYVSFGGCEEVL